jgi:non-ribosomal peptide synthetase-like protein
VEDNGRIEELSLLPEGKVVGAGETWAGSPARRVAGARLLRTLPDLPSRARRAFFAAMHGLASLLLPAFVLAAIFPGLALMTSLDQRWGGAWYLLSTPIVGLLFVTVMALEIVLVKRLLLGRVKPGTYRLDSFFFLRKWFFDQLMDESLDVLTPLYASLYLAPWYRLLGAKLGRRAEISTAAQTAPDLLEVGDESFVADAVALGTSRVEDGRVSLAPTRIGRRAFVGNSALVVGGTDIGDDALIGVLTKPAGDKVPARTSWLGSPAVLLPNRQTSAEFGAESTFRPTRRLIALRASIEFVRILAPASFFVLFTATLVLVNHQLAEVLPLWASIALFPVAFATCAFLLTAVVVACKWLVVGRYRPAEKPLWSDFVWRNELVTALHDCVADPLWNEKMAGTPFAAFYYRWMGARVGSRVFLDTTEFTEYDLVEIGDDVALNSDCTVQTHLFEDRVMKMSTVRIGNGCTVGGQSVVLYGTEMHDGSSLDEQSLLMKGEVLPAGSAWIGIPARPLRGARG